MLTYQSTLRIYQKIDRKLADAAAAMRRRPTPEHCREVEKLRAVHYAMMHQLVDHQARGAVDTFRVYRGIDRSITAALERGMRAGRGAREVAAGITRALLRGGVYSTIAHRARRWLIYSEARAMEGDHMGERERIWALHEYLNAGVDG